MATIEISDTLYERIAKIAQAQPLPTSPEREIEKAIIVRLLTWEPFFFGVSLAGKVSQAMIELATLEKGDTT